ncbi:myotrophin [Frankliniella occidentalis]|uniref:Myotrophin n=1 Tax=Frankliniella occidentalis TaxID=133901 RepID=A0A6J1SM73_FRAOC|nr:myotrophin [Frankliniella occidentalis]
MSELVWGIKNGDMDQVKDIVDNKEIDVNKDIDGRAPIHYAADYGQEDVIRYLVSKGADVNAKDKHGISVLLAAVWEGHTSCVKLLLEKGASKEGTTPDGTTYYNAAEKEEIKQLLK